MPLTWTTLLPASSPHSRTPSPPRAWSRSLKRVTRHTPNKADATMSAGGIFADGPNVTYAVKAVEVSSGAGLVLVEESCMTVDTNTLNRTADNMVTVDTPSPSSVQVDSAPSEVIAAAAEASDCEVMLQARLLQSKRGKGAIRIKSAARKTVKHDVDVEYRMSSGRCCNSETSGIDSDNDGESNDDMALPAIARDDFDTVKKASLPPSILKLAVVQDEAAEKTPQKWIQTPVIALDMGFPEGHPNRGPYVILPKEKRAPQTPVHLLSLFEPPQAASEVVSIPASSDEAAGLLQASNSIDTHATQSDDTLVPAGASTVSGLAALLTGEGTHKPESNVQDAHRSTLSFVKQDMSIPSIRTPQRPPRLVKRKLPACPPGTPTQFDTSKQVSEHEFVTKLIAGMCSISNFQPEDVLKVAQKPDLTTIMEEEDEDEECSAEEALEQESQCQASPCGLMDEDSNIDIPDIADVVLTPAIAMGESILVEEGNQSAPASKAILRLAGRGMPTGVANIKARIFSTRHPPVTAKSSATLLTSPSKWLSVSRTSSGSTLPSITEEAESEDEQECPSLSYDSEQCFQVINDVSRVSSSLYSADVSFESIERLVMGKDDAFAEAFRYKHEEYPSVSVAHTVTHFGRNLLRKVSMGGKRLFKTAISGRKTTSNLTDQVNEAKTPGKAVNLAKLCPSPTAADIWGEQTQQALALAASAGNVSVESSASNKYSLRPFQFSSDMTPFKPTDSGVGTPVSDIAMFTPSTSTPSRSASFRSYADSLDTPLSIPGMPLEAVAGFHFAALAARSIGRTWSPDTSLTPSIKVIDASPLARKSTAPASTNDCVFSGKATVGGRISPLGIEGTRMRATTYVVPAASFSKKSTFEDKDNYAYTPTKSGFQRRHVMPLAMARRESNEDLKVGGWLRMAPPAVLANAEVGVRQWDRR